MDTYINLELVKNISVPIELDRGVGNLSRRGEFLTYNASSNIVKNESQAWKKPVAINGTLDLFLDPLSVNQWVSFFSPEQLRNLYFKPNKSETYQQLSINLLLWEPTNFMQDLDTFDSKYAGINNLSRFRNYPWVSTLKYFSRGRPC